MQLKMRQRSLIVVVLSGLLCRFSRAVRAETERLSACLKTAFDNDPELC